MNLTSDQRWLLFGVGGWHMVASLADPEHGIPSLFQSMMGSTHLGDETYAARPQWKGYGFSTDKVIRLGWRGDDTAPNVTVSRQQLATYAKNLPAGTSELLRANRRTTTNRARVSFPRTRRHVQLPGAPRLPLEQHRPDWSRARQIDEYTTVGRRLRAEETRLLRFALDLEQHEPTDLLELLALGG